MPTELDEQRRKIMQMEIEEAALKKETDKLSAERLENLQKELADLRTEFDTKKAQRYFKERGIKFQMIDLKEKGMSRGEFDNVARALGGWEALVNPAAKDKQTLALLDALVDWQKEDKLFENQQLFKTPIVRNGRKATVGYQPEIWKDWE